MGKFGHAVDVIVELEVVRGVLGRIETVGRLVVGFDEVLLVVVVVRRVVVVFLVVLIVSIAFASSNSLFIDFSLTDDVTAGTLCNFSQRRRVKLFAL